jgi:hypothetical protein
MSMITNALNLHLNIQQSTLVNTSSIIMSLKKMTIDTLSNQMINLNDKTQIFLPNDLQLNSTNSFRVRQSLLCKYISLIFLKPLVN